MNSVLKPSFEQLMDVAVDITQPDMPIEIKISHNGVIWVNVGPVCVLRICRTEEITVVEERKGKA